MSRDLTSGPVRISLRIYRWLLTAYPAEYRREWAEPMEQLFRDCAGEAFSRSGFRGLSALWFRTLWDYATSLVREYRRPRVRRTPAVAARANPLANFTPRAQQALAFARREVDRRGHECVGTAHLLLGILGQNENAGVLILRKMGVDTARLRAALESSLIQGSIEKREGSIPFSPQVKKALARAGREALSLGHGYLGCEHILVGLTLDKDGLAQGVLNEFGVNSARCHAEILKTFPRGFKGGPDPLDVAVVRPDSAFAGEGRSIGRDASGRHYGHVRLRLILMQRGRGALRPRVVFDVTEKHFPNEQWAVIQGAIQGKWQEDPSAFGDWFVVVQVVGGSFEPGAAPAFDRAASAALGDALEKAVAAGLLPRR